MSTNIDQMPNCPNCGAPIIGPKCEYCDTVFRGLRSKIPGIIDDACGIDSVKLDMMLNCGYISPNKTRELLNLPPITDPIFSY